MKLKEEAAKRVPMAMLTAKEGRQERRKHGDERNPRASSKQVKRKKEMSRLKRAPGVEI